MQAIAKIVAVLQNPDGLWEDETSVTMPDASYSRSAILRIVSAIAGSGGLVREISSTEVQFIPMCRVKDINVALSNVALADNLDMAKAITPHLIKS